MPRSEGAGTSLTGNVCRKAFSNPALLSEVLCIDKNLLILLSLQTIVTKITKFSKVFMVTGIKFLLQFAKSLHMVLITF